MIRPSSWWPVLAGAMVLAAGLATPLALHLSGPALAMALVAAGMLATAAVLLTSLASRRGRDLATAQMNFSRLESLRSLQHSVFEASSELVGCVEEEDARERFAAALGRYWTARALDLFLWQRGEWKSLGGDAAGAAPTLTGPVQLPGEQSPDLVLDLSPAIEGQAAVVLREATDQPPLVGAPPAVRRGLAEILRGQLALSLRRVLLYHDLQNMGRTDPLTGACRRWYGEERLNELVEAGRVVSVAMLDIDHFKAVNDTAGHAAGDQVLAALGRCLRTKLRTGDLVYRYGGEEFVVILPNTSPAGAMQVAERLRVAVAALGDLPQSITVSIGVASCLMDENAIEMVARADAAMYLAKTQGRNRVIQAETGTTGTSGMLMVRTTQRRKREGGGTQY